MEQRRSDYVERSPYYITGQWLEAATDPEDIGTADAGIPIVAWWSTTCIAKRQIDSWISLGALTASGAVDVQFRPNAWGNYIDAWTGGDHYRKAVDDSETPAVIAESELLVHTQGALPPWSCPADGSVLLDGPCAEAFFLGTETVEAAYKIWEIYDPLLPGAVNMAVSSERTFLGDTQITFGAPGRDWPKGP